MSRTILTTAFMLTVAVAACDKRTTNEASGSVLPTAPTSAAPAACVAQVTWGRDVNVAAPKVKLVPSRVVEAIRLWDFDWNHVEDFTGPFMVFERELRHHRYEVQARIGECWSEPWPMDLGPNPDNSGSGPRPPDHQGDQLSWGDCTATVFTAGVAVEWYLDIPAGRYRAVVMAKDHNHGPDYQIGQVEQLELSLVGDRSVGVSSDIPDLAKEQASSFEFSTDGASGVRLAGVRGSVHGACVSVVEVR